MSAVLQRAPIKLLPAQLADQIAAGEVIERPASVLKELIENALDAGATRLDIEMTAGGMDRIRVTDNGIGIVCDELVAAINRHATSKISQLSDLLTLNTLGFRGEALASICSVSQWQLISASSSDNQACKLSHQQPDRVMTDHHPRGTTMQVDRLFYNTPARKKFLRAERTEYRHCDDVLRRMALSRFDVGFYVSHNGRMCHRLPAVKEDIGRTRRVTKLCGERFIRESLAVDFPRDGMRLWGWISNADYSRQQTDLQYFYINGRIVRDRTINHAIRLAYQQVLATGRHAAYVLHLDLDPSAFDVNVHPTKQEVRFRETRLVHDFISRSLRQALQNGEISQLVTTEQSVVAEQYPEYRHAVINQATAGSNHHMIVLQRYLFNEQQGRTVLVDLKNTQAIWTAMRWHKQITDNAVITRPLLIPVRVKLNKLQQDKWARMQPRLAELGFDISLISESEAMLRYTPVILDAYDANGIVELILGEQFEQTTPAALQELLVDIMPDTDKLNISSLMQAINDEPDQYRSCWREINTADLSRLFR